MRRIVPDSEVFIGCYHGSQKPASSNVFLKEFVEEAIEVVNNGIKHNGITVNIDIHSIIADAPAKSFLTCTKGHIGYSSCSKCQIEGEYLQNRICFPGITASKRTDQSFVDLADDDYHTGHSILSDIPRFGMVTQIPLDYMHLVCIGVFKRMIRLWWETFLSINDISNKLYLKNSYKFTTFHIET